MPAKGKKIKKKNDSKGRSKDVQNEKNESKANIYHYLSSDEIAEVKSLLKIKDMSGVSLVICSTVLNKMEMLKKLVNQGHNVNETGYNNMTALMWAVKFNNLEIIDFLLSKGANPSMKIDNGDNVLIVALENKLWEEQAFINLWNSVKKCSFIDVNHTSKNGHNMLHIAVRRDWEKVINILISEKVNVDVANANGVTPLMLACFRNNLNIVNILVNAGANIIREDNHGRMALCYAISTGMKSFKPPYAVADALITELKKHSTLKEYLKRRVQMIATLAEKSEISYATSEMLINIIKFTVHFSGGGIKHLLEFNIFHEINRALKKASAGQETIKFYFAILREILSYNEQSISFSPEIQNLMAETFIASNLTTMCLSFFKNDEDTFNAAQAFYLLVHFSTLNDIGYDWLKENHDAFLHIPESSGSHLQQDFNEEYQQIMSNKIKKFRRLLNTIEISKKEQKEETHVSLNEKVFFVSKRARKRHKALKTKIATVKIVELPEKPLGGAKKVEKEKLPPFVNLEDSQPYDSSCRCICTGLPNHCLREEENPIAYGLLQFLHQENNLYKNNKSKCKFGLRLPRLKPALLSLSFSDFPDLSKNLSVDKQKLNEASQYIKQAAYGEKLEKLPIMSIASVADVILEYLSELLNLILAKYHTHWEVDKHLCPLREELYRPYLNRKRRQYETLEKEIVDDLQKQFDSLINSIRESSTRNIMDCFRALYNLESTLLNFTVRNRNMMLDVAPYESLSNQAFWKSYREKKLNLEIGAEEVLNPIKETKPEVGEQGDELYLQEMSSLPLSRPKNRIKELEDKKKTMENAYHLCDSIIALCDSEEDMSKKPDINRRTFKRAPMDNLMDHAPSTSYSELVLKALTKHVESSSHLTSIPSRWADRIQGLQNMKDSQKLLGGDVRISNLRVEKRQDHIISQGGNFNPVVLGLNQNNQPLAVKRIPREHSVCKIMKSLINPLLGLRNTHILHYYVCDYEENELILATPLCEFNVGQYVLLMKEMNNNNFFNLTPTDIVRQFLVGLKFLHTRSEPIVHGNLKPSNIFIDLNGVVRVAEFGTHKALFKIVEAPKSSLIWFAQETYNIYKQTSQMECTIKSDVQVAGMLVYFILSGGVHPYGSNVTVILKNLEKAILNLTGTQDVILVDLITWMMLYNPNERPGIEQILSHVIFWSSSRRWMFILDCAGAIRHGDDFDPAKLHCDIEKKCLREGIKCSWINVTKDKFPNLYVGSEDSIIGLLRFIKRYCKQQNITDLRESDLSNFILSHFPSFPLYLYRILESTSWLKHQIFAGYAGVDSLLL